MSVRDEAIESEALARAIMPLLAGKDAGVQGAALADLLAMWLAGHFFLGDPERSERIREQMLAAHLETVRKLIQINYKMRIEPQLKARKH
jgi:hypothetical protein